MPESNPFANTVFEIRSGFSSTALCVSEEPIVVTIPSPTRATIVSSPAPPTNRSMLARTVTLDVALTWMPSLATAVTIGVEITLGLTLTCTASSTLRPARSMAAARSVVRLIPALSAAIRAVITFSTCPPDRKCASRKEVGIVSPALVALI